MRRRDDTLRFLFALTALCLAANVALAKPDTADNAVDNAARTLALIDAWIGGTYDNSAQIATEVAAGIPEDEQGMRLHQVITPVRLTGFDGLTFYSQLTNDGMVDTLLAVGLYHFYPDADSERVVMSLRMFDDTVRFTDAHLEPERLQGVSPDDVHSTDGCEFYLSANADGTQVEGAMKEHSCFPVSRRTGQRLMHVDELIIKPGEFWNNARYYDLDGNFLFGNARGGYQKQIRIDSGSVDNPSP